LLAIYLDYRTGQRSRPVAILDPFETRYEPVTVWLSLGDHVFHALAGATTQKPTLVDEYPVGGVGV
jgi:hypothetical protein